MKRILGGLVILLMISAVAYAADTTQEVSVGITGSDLFTFSVTSGGTLTITDDGAIGETDTSLTGGPTLGEMLDNDITPVDDAVIVKAKLNDVNTTYYGTSSTYYLQLQSLAFTTDGASTINVETSAATVNLITDDGDCFQINGTTGDVLEGDFTMDAHLIVNADKRMLGSTSESYTMTLTGIDTAGP